jgi:hypothetical protein
MLHEESDSLGDAMITTVAADNLADAGTSVFDAALSVVEEASTTVADAGMQVWQHIPVVGVLFKLYKAGVAVNQQLFTRKLLLFLNELERVSIEERKAFVSDFDQDPIFRQKVGDNLILILDKADDIEKASLLGRIFTLYITKLIDYSTYMRFAIVINRAHFPDIIALKKSVFKEGISEPVFTQMELESLNSIGIVGEVAIANNDPFPYKGPTDPPGPDRLFAYFTLLGSKLSEIIKQLY